MGTLLNLRPGAEEEVLGVPPTHACTHMRTYTSIDSSHTPMHTHGYIHPGIYPLCTHASTHTTLNISEALKSFSPFLAHEPSCGMMNSLPATHLLPPLDLHRRLLKDSAEHPLPARQQHTYLPETIPAPCSSAPSPHNTHCNSSF